MQYILYMSPKRRQKPHSNFYKWTLKSDYQGTDNSRNRSVRHQGALKLSDVQKEQLASSAPEPKKSLQDGAHLAPDLMGKEGHEGWPFHKPTLWSTKGAISWNTVQGVAREAGQGVAPSLGKLLWSLQGSSIGHSLVGAREAAHRKASCAAGTVKTYKVAPRLEREALLPPWQSRTTLDPYWLTKENRLKGPDLVTEQVLKAGSGTEITDLWLLWWVA